MDRPRPFRRGPGVAVPGAAPEQAPARQEGRQGHADHAGRAQRKVAASKRARPKKRRLAKPKRKPAQPVSRPPRSGHQSQFPSQTHAQVDARWTSADAIADAAKGIRRCSLGEAARRTAGLRASSDLTGEYEVDEFGFDREVTERFIMAALRPLAEKWFRIEVRGVENIPAEGGALVVSNHSGTVPIDGLMTGLVVHDHTDRFLRMLGADLVFSLPFIGELARKGGATLASNEDAERMLSRGDLVGVWPEGFKGIGKPFPSAISCSVSAEADSCRQPCAPGVPIVPCSVVGAEEIYPLVGNMPSLARLLGVPYIPITPLFPWLGARA